MFTPLRKHVAHRLKSHGSKKSGAKQNALDKQKKLEKQLEEDDVTSPTSDCSDMSLSSMSFANSTPVYRGVTESSADYGYGEAEPDVSTRNLFQKDTAPKRRTNTTNVDQYGYNEASPEQRGSACRRTPRRSSMKQSGQPRRASIQFSGEKEIALPNTGKKVRRRTSISFNEGVHVKPIARVMDLTEHSEKLWFQDNEYDEMKERCYNLVDKAECGIKKEGKKPCLRGLEGMMKEQSKQKRNLRVQAWDAVLDLQDEQMDSETFDDQAMANAMKLSSIESRIEAARRAKQDEEEVKKYLSSTRRMCRRLSC